MNIHDANCSIIQLGSRFCTCGAESRAIRRNLEALHEEQCAAHIAELEAKVARANADLESFRSQFKDRCEKVVLLEAKVAALTKLADSADKDAPKEVWLQLYGDQSIDDDGPVDYQSGGVTWCWHKIHERDVLYVQARASADQEPKA